MLSLCRHAERREIVIPDKRFVIPDELLVIPDLYGCLPDSKKNLCCVVKKSAAYLYPALIS